MDQTRPMVSMMKTRVQQLGRSPGVPESWVTPGELELELEYEASAESPAGGGTDQRGSKTGYIGLTAFSDIFRIASKLCINEVQS